MKKIPNDRDMSKSLRTNGIIFMREFCKNFTKLNGPFTFTFDPRVVWGSAAPRRCHWVGHGRIAGWNSSPDCLLLLARNPWEGKRVDSNQLGPSIRSCWVILAEASDRSGYFEPSSRFQPRIVSKPIRVLASFRQSRATRSRPSHHDGTSWHGRSWAFCGPVSPCSASGPNTDQRCSRRMASWRMDRAWFLVPVSRFSWEMFF